MEEYLGNVKSLLSYMNDLDEDETKRSAEEQQKLTAIDAHDAEIVLVRAQVKSSREEAEKLVGARAQVCVDMVEKHGRIAVLEVEGATLTQTLELLHQETGTTSAKLNDKRLFYTKTTQNLAFNLQELQVSTSHRKQNTVEGESHRMVNPEEGVDKLKQERDPVNKERELSFQVEPPQLKIEGIKSKRSALLSEINKNKQIIEQEKIVIAGFPAALQQMEWKSLEEDYKALQGDKAEEIRYFKSLDEAIEGMKSIADLVKCPCGLEYKVELGGEAMDIS